MKYFIGIDEVGRGPLAGPVVVTAAAIPQNFKISRRILGKLKDSKQLSEKQREDWYRYFMTEKRISFSVARIYPLQIDQTNISKSANKAAFLAYGRLLRKDKALKNHQVLLDGGLYLKNKKESLGVYGAKTIIKGDEKHLPIMIASVIAKVTRDRYMKNLAKKHPGYGFELHKGYGTKLHQEAIRNMGPSSAHRVSFLKFLTYENMS